MPKFKIESTLMNRDAALSTFWSTLQQMIVAASTFFILRAIERATNSDMRSATWYISGFVISLVLVYLPGSLSVIYLQKWRFTSFASFVERFAAANFGKTTRGHSSHKFHSESWLTNESSTVYEHATNLLYQIYSTLLNSALNILVIAFALDQKILIWYLLAFAALIFSNRIFKSKLSEVSKDAQQSRKILSTSMLSAWDNIFTGNNHNFSNWQTRFLNNLSDAREGSARLERIRAALSSGAMIVALIIVAIGNGLFFLENLNRLPVVAALFVTLPRQIQIIQSIFSLYAFSLSWTGTLAQLKELESIVEPQISLQDPTTFITFSEIDFSLAKEKFVHSHLKCVERFLESRSNGRISIRGKNGAGKSTLLSLLKETYGERAFLLPTRFMNLSFKNDISVQSDGNRLRDVMNEIEVLDGIHVVILDEWDANLDPANVREVSLAIDRMATRKLVIESRHRNELEIVG